MNFVPKKVFFVKGTGNAKDCLSSFENALCDAGISKFNLVTVSSIFPPGCKIISREEGLKLLKPGQIVFCVLSRISSNKPNKRISASVGCAFLKNKAEKYGYLSNSTNKPEKYTEKIAASMLASSLGSSFSSLKQFETSYIFQSAVCKKKMHTTAIAAAVFVI